VLQSTYRSTHDYQLDARLLVPRASGPAAVKGLQESFGRCQAGALAPMPTAGLTSVCVFANDDAVAGDAETTSRLYSVGTGLRKDGARVIAMSIKSR
jgi:hypothetical protein